MLSRTCNRLAVAAAAGAAAERGVPSLLKRRVAVSLEALFLLMFFTFCHLLVFNLPHKSLSAQEGLWGKRTRLPRTAAAAAAVVAGPSSLAVLFSGLSVSIEAF